MLVNPADPWNEFNLEADRAMADDKLHAVLAPRMAAARVFSIKAAGVRPNKVITKIKLRRKEPTMPLIQIEQENRELIAQVRNQIEEMVERTHKHPGIGMIAEEFVHDYLRALVQLPTH